jgi:hypothetical protein
MNHRARTRPLIRLLVRVPGCLALLSGLLLGGAGAAAAAPGWADPVPTRMLPMPPGGTDRIGTALTGTVTPLSTAVGEEENGDFTLSVTNTGTVTAQDVRVLLDEATAGNGVGSADGRCLSRLDVSSPADLWCELGDLEPQSTVTVEVHAYMLSCVWFDPEAADLRAPAFSWRIGYTDGTGARTANGPTPRWSCDGLAGGGAPRPGVPAARGTGVPSRLPVRA